MTNKRTCASLYIIDILYSKGKINMVDTCGTLDISQITFKRSIAEIRNFLIEHRPDLEVLYSKRDGVYTLVDYGKILNG